MILESILTIFSFSQVDQLGNASYFSILNSWTLHQVHGQPPLGIYTGDMYRTQRIYGLLGFILAWFIYYKSRLGFIGEINPHKWINGDLWVPNFTQGALRRGFMGQGSSNISYGFHNPNTVQIDSGAPPPPPKKKKKKKKTKWCWKKKRFCWTKYFL